MKKAIFLDFFGTVVHEDEKIIPAICESISKTAKQEVAGQEVYHFWSTKFAQLLLCYGDEFKYQREAELLSLQETVSHFGAEADPLALSQPLYEHWTKPPIFEDSKAFLTRVKLPVCIVSNIDRPDLLQAIKHHNLKVDHIVTSEDARSYKPRPEIFLLALNKLSLMPEDVVHVGDSLTSDVMGAKRLGMAAVWVNRKKRELPRNFVPDYVCEDLAEMLTSPYLV